MLESVLREGTEAVEDPEAVGGVAGPAEGGIDVIKIAPRNIH